MPRASMQRKISSSAGGGSFEAEDALFVVCFVVPEQALFVVCFVVPEQALFVGVLFWVEASDFLESEEAVAWGPRASAM